MVLPQARLRDQTGKGAPFFSYVPLAIVSPARVSLCGADDLVVDGI
jgi:hypothetical protein